MIERLSGTIRSEATLRGSISVEGALSGRLTTTLPDGGYERGYNEGYIKGEADGKIAGYDEGLAARTYEIWMITLSDGTMVEKEVSLL